MDKPEIIQYQTQGTCCQMMEIAIQEGKIIDAQFFGGCNGNLKGIRNLVKGMSIEEVIEKLKGIPCGSKSTSCPDQLAQCLIEYKQRKLAAK